MPELDDLTDSVNRKFFEKEGASETRGFGRRLALGAAVFIVAAATALSVGLTQIPAQNFALAERPQAATSIQIQASPADFLAALREQARGEQVAVQVLARANANARAEMMRVPGGVLDDAVNAGLVSTQDAIRISRALGQQGVSPATIEQHAGGIRITLTDKNLSAFMSGQNGMGYGTGIAYRAEEGKVEFLRFRSDRKETDPGVSGVVAVISHWGIIPLSGDLVPERIVEPRPIEELQLLPSLNNGYQVAASQVADNFNAGTPAPSLGRGGRSVADGQMRALDVDFGPAMKFSGHTARR